MSTDWRIEFRTAKQADAVDWAYRGADEEHDYLYELHEGGPEAVARPTWNGRVLTGGCAHTIGDLLFRLEVQLKSRSYDETGGPEIAALNAAKKIRAVTGVDHHGWGNPIKAPDIMHILVSVEGGN